MNEFWGVVSRTSVLFEEAAGADIASFDMVRLMMLIRVVTKLEVVAGVHFFLIYG